MSKELDGQIKKLMAQSQRKIAEENKKQKSEDPVAQFLSGMTQAQFATYSNECDSKNDWKCSITTYACKDYLCPRLKHKETHS